MKITGLKQYGNILLRDAMAFADDAPEAVERDDQGVPVAWRLLAAGDNPGTKNGEDYVLNLDAADMRSIVDYHDKKGVKIPIDSEHHVYNLAKAKGLDENALLKLLPGGTATLGFGDLALRDGDLWFAGVSWNPTAYELMKEKTYRYFSPVIRGLKKDPLRITSVAMDNTPSFNNQDILAASAEDDGENPQIKRRSSMTRLNRALAKLLGIDTIAFESEGENLELAEKVEQKAKLLDEFRKSLNLGPDVGDDVIIVALKSIIEKAGGADKLLAELGDVRKTVDELVASAETRERAELFERGFREGKIVDSTKPLWEKMGTAEFRNYLPNAPVIVPVDRIRRGSLAKSDDVAMSAEEEKIVRKLGVSREDYLKERKGE